MYNNFKGSISLGGFNELIRMRDGWIVYNKNDRFIGRSLKEYGEWSQGEIDLCKQILTPVDVVIEVGSNIGSHTLALSKIVQKGTIYSFEPQAVVFLNLCANISINSITNCVCSQSALSDSNLNRLFYPKVVYSQEGNFGGISLSNENIESSIEANVEILDERFFNLKKLKLLKIDAEGMEINIIKGGINLLKRTKPFLYVENEIAHFDKSQELIELIFSLGYRIFWHIVPMFNEDNFFNNPENIFTGLGSSNMLCIRDDFTINTDLPEIKDSSLHPFKK